jgi:hypothetical protein
MFPISRSDADLPLIVSILLVNAIAILSEDRFLARSRSPLGRFSVLLEYRLTRVAVNLSPSSYDPAFGQSADGSVKAKIINLIASVRTLMRSEFFYLVFNLLQDPALT